MKYDPFICTQVIGTLLTNTAFETILKTNLKRFKTNKQVDENEYNVFLLSNQ